jgi:AcrR family transcriptional regulator
VAVEKADLRREAGQRTRERLLAAALDQIAERGQEGITLREITENAGANVAAVSYHFGSLKTLCDTAIELALERYLDAQIESVRSLGPEPTLEDLAAAWARPMVRAIAAGGPDLAVMRTVARAGIDPPEGWDRLSGKFDQTRQDAIQAMRANLPGVKEPELIFRIRCAAGMLNWLALAPIGRELASKSARQIERMLIPVVAGAFRGGK